MTETRNRRRRAERKSGTADAPSNVDSSSTPKKRSSSRRATTTKNRGNGKAAHSTNQKNSNRNNSSSGNNSNRNNSNRNGSSKNNNRGGRSNRHGRNVVHSMQGADLTQRLPEPPKAPKNGLRIIALGGISEIGRNMTVFEYKNRMLLVDCGVLFPSSGEPGVDLILPDFSYIENRLDEVEALVITHGHEDHIGAIPFLLRHRPDLPILASKFTCALISAKCQEHRQRPKLIEVNELSEVDRGPFNIRFFNVGHSLPDCLGIVLKTGAGTILHTGDIKLDQTPPDGRPTDLPAISRFGDEGIDLLMCDSTNATTPGISGSEADVAPTIKRLVMGAKQRVILASFASNVYRVQAAVDAAVAAGRKVAFNGRSMIRNMDIAQQLGYLQAPRGTFVKMDEAAKMAPHKIMLITTGTQGEPMAALSRMARREHRQITVRDGDLIILSSSLVPGNEEAVFGVINMLAQIGATVVTSRDARVHTSGHGYAGELLFIYNAARPVNAMPVHGEWRHLRANKELAISTGVDPERVVLAQNGVVVDLVDGRAQVVGQIPIGHLYVDGTTMGDVGEHVLADRTELGESGLIALTAVIDNRSGRLLERPTVQARGFSEDAKSMMPEIAELAENIMLDLAGEGENDTYRMVQQLRRRIRKYTEKKWQRSPMIVPTVVQMASPNEGPDDEDVAQTVESR